MTEYNIGDEVMIVGKGSVNPFGWNEEMDDQIGRVAKILRKHFDRGRHEWKYHISGPAGSWSWAGENFAPVDVLMDLPEFQVESVDAMMSMLSL